MYYRQYRIIPSDYIKLFLVTLFIESNSDLLMESEIPELDINNYTGNLQSSKKFDSSMEESSWRQKQNQNKTCSVNILKWYREEMNK